MRRPRVIFVVAYDRRGVMGRDGALPWHLPEDLKHFKRLTLEKPVIMGRKTFDSIGRALPGRRTIVVTRNPSWSHPDVETAHSLADALALAGPADEVFVVGGGEVYGEAMPFAQQMLLTEVPDAPEGDTFFPEWVVQDWREVDREHHDGFDIATYERV